jgi:hypothetical protein
VFTRRFGEAIYVLHSFPKKCPQRIKTAERDLEIVARRLRIAAELHKKWLVSEQRRSIPQQPQPHKTKRSK